jgi:DNA-binding response OmpR family regulator
VIQIPQLSPFDIPSEEIHSNGEMETVAGQTGSASRLEPQGAIMVEPTFTVLVVDDEPFLRQFIVDVLQRNGFAPLEAVDEVQGLELFKANRDRIDLVILDMVMPVMGGLDLAAELERQRPGVKVLYISTDGSSIAMQCILRQSADGVLFKPFTGPALVERVSLLLHKPGAATARAWKFGGG